MKKIRRYLPIPLTDIPFEINIERVAEKSNLDSNTQ